MSLHYNLISRDLFISFDHLQCSGCLWGVIRRQGGAPGTEHCTGRLSGPSLAAISPVIWAHFDNKPHHSFSRSVMTALALASDWSGLVTWPAYWPLIGRWGRRWLWGGILSSRQPDWVNALSRGHKDWLQPGILIERLYIDLSWKCLRMKLKIDQSVSACYFDDWPA